LTEQNKCLLPLTPISLSTRSKRRKALKVVINELDKIKDAEEAYLQRIPMNLTGSDAYSAADDCVSIISDAMLFLMDAFEY